MYFRLGYIHQYHHNSSLLFAWQTLPGKRKSKILQCSCNQRWCQDKQQSLDIHQRRSILGESEDGPTIKILQNSYAKEKASTDPTFN